MSLRNTRRGNAAIFALTLVPMLGFGALSVDIGMQRMTSLQVQAAVEAATSGGAAFLDGTSDGLATAVSKAVAIGNANYVFGGQFALTDADVKIGIYDEGDGSFTEVDVNYAVPTDVNMLWIEGSTKNNAILSSYAFGVAELDSAGDARSYQRRGGVAKYVDCYLPFAIPRCHFINLGQGSNPPPLMLDLANLNTVGWGLANELGSNVDNNPNTNKVKGQLANTCSSGTAATCDELNADGSCASGGTDVNISNGQNNAAVSYVGMAINDDYTTGSNPVSENVGPWPSNYFPDGPYQRGDANGDGWVGSTIQDVCPTGPSNPNDVCWSEDFANATSGGKASGIDGTRWGYSVNGVVPIIEHGCGENFTGEAAIVGWTYAYIYDVLDTGGSKNLWMQFDFVNDYDIGYGQCQGDCYGNVSGTYPPVQVL